MQIANVADRMLERQQNLIKRSDEIVEELNKEGSDDESAEGIAALTAEVLKQAKSLKISIDLGESKVVAEEATYEDLTDGGSSGAE